MPELSREGAALIHTDFKCEFYFIRHGESVSNATPGFAAGRDYDAPLTDKGFSQARLLGTRLKKEGTGFDRVYSSSLARADQTTRTMLDAMGEVDREYPRVDALIEQQVPGWRGVPQAEIDTPENLAYIRGKGAHFVGPQGESMRVVQRRVSNWLEDEIIYNESLTGSPLALTIGIVGHGNASRALFQYIMGFDERFLWRVALDNTSISRFVFDRGGWAVVALNDSAHLHGAEPSFESSV
jgi:2,3-bisphosphoglycerate-dependent phosphoglycerate mutase